jgi:nucleotide-binding universal stress UspA family protein
MLSAVTGTTRPSKDARLGDAVEVNYASVLIPLDGSELAERALGPAQWLARTFGADLHVVAADVRRDEAAWYQTYLDKVQRGLGVSHRHVSDDPDVARAVVTAARDAEPCLVCIATHGRSRMAAIVGSTFARLAARHDSPLVAVGPRAGHALGPAGAETGPVDRLAVCVDGSHCADRALPLAAAWARRLGWRVRVVTAADPVLMPREYGYDAEAYLHDIAHRPVFDGLAVDTKVLWGIAYPHVLIGDHLDHHPAALVVATTHARTGLARAALGSEVARIIHRSPAPVLVQPLPRADAPVSDQSPR